MKKKIFISMTVLMLTLTMVGCGCQKKEKSPEKKPDALIPDDINRLLDKTEKIQGNLLFEDTKISENGATNTVTSKVTNNGKDTVTFIAKFILKNNNGKILGRVEKTIENLKSKETSEVSISIMGDYSTVDTFEVTSEIIK